jgi:hypothetical protein
MQRRKRLAAAVVTLVLCLGSQLAGAQGLVSDLAEDVPDDVDRETIDVAICLDTSSSMRPLIDTTRFRRRGCAWPC